MKPTTKEARAINLARAIANYDNGGRNSGVTPFQQGCVTHMKAMASELCALLAADAGPGWREQALEDEVQRLRAALEPFSVVAASVLSSARFGKRRDAHPWVSRLDRTKITYGDLRRAIFVPAAAPAPDAKEEG